MKKNKIYSTYKCNVSSYSCDSQLKSEINSMIRLLLPNELFFKKINDDTFIELGSRVKFSRFHDLFINREYCISITYSNITEVEEENENYKLDDYKNITQDFFRRANQILFCYDVVRNNTFKTNNDFKNINVKTYTSLLNKDYLYGIKTEKLFFNVGTENCLMEFDTLKSNLFENMIFNKLNDKEYREIYSGRLYMSCYDINNKEIFYNHETGTYFYSEDIKEYYRTNSIITHYGNEKELPRLINGFYSSVKEIKEKDDRTINQIQFLQLINKEK